MIILDTDVLSLLQQTDSIEGIRVRSRIAELPPTENVAATIVTYEEHIRGWMNFIAKARTTAQQLNAYRLLGNHLRDYRETTVLDYERNASLFFEQLRPKHPRIGVMDLRIASIALANNALLITRNTRDFEKIADLRIEDWTRE